MLTLEMTQHLITIAARNPRLYHSLSLLQATRSEFKWGTPEYYLLDHIIMRNCYMDEVQGPRLENGMFLSAFAE